MMQMKSQCLSYAKYEDVEILELRYKGDEISMLILLPTEDIGAFEISLNLEKYEDWKHRMKKIELDKIYLPKFTLETKNYLKKALKSMGLTSAFSPNEANFSNITKSKVYISSVIHQAYISVDEIGTKAAAATAVPMAACIEPPKPIFNANHPFLFVIQDNLTGIILFMGKMMDPTKL